MKGKQRMQVQTDQGRYRNKELNKNIPNTFSLKVRHTQHRQAESSHRFGTCTTLLVGVELVC